MLPLKQRYFNLLIYRGVIQTKHIIKQRQGHMGKMTGKHRSFDFEMPVWSSWKGTYTKNNCESYSIVVTCEWLYLTWTLFMISTLTWLEFNLYGPQMFPSSCRKSFNSLCLCGVACVAPGLGLIWMHSKCLSWCIILFIKTLLQHWVVLVCVHHCIAD